MAKPERESTIQIQSVQSEVHAQGQCLFVNHLAAGHSNGAGWHHYLTRLNRRSRAFHVHSNG